MPYWTPFALAARLRKKKNMHGSSKVHMRIILVEHDQYAWKPRTGGGRGGVSLPNLPQPTTVDMTHDVFWPWYARSLFGQTAAAGCLWVSVSVCDEGGVGLSVGFIKWRKKLIKKTPKYLGSWPCVVTFPSLHRPTWKWVQLEFTCEATPTRHCDASSPVWKKGPKLFCWGFFFFCILFL